MIVFRARVDGKSLVLNVGKSHDVILPIPDGLTVTINANTQIKVQGMDNEAIGQFCANVRKERPPEPYKGKGIRFAGEVVCYPCVMYDLFRFQYCLFAPCMVASKVLSERIFVGEIIVGYLS